MRFTFALIIATSISCGAQSPVPPAPPAPPAKAAPEKTADSPGIKATSPEKSPETVPEKQPSSEEKIVAEFKAIAKRLEMGTKVKVSDFENPGKVWQKRRFGATDIKIDVQRTNSLTSPFVGKLNWTQLAWISSRFATSEEAEKADLPKVPKVGNKNNYHAEYQYVDGRWVYRDAWWYSASLGVGAWDSKSEKRDPVHDWGEALRLD